MKRLATVDDTLKELGTPKIYRQLHTYVIRVLIGWFVCIHIANTLDCFWWFSAVEDHRCMILPFITNHFHHVNMFEDLLFITFLWFVLYYAVYLIYIIIFLLIDLFFIVLIHMYFTKSLLFVKKKQYAKED